MLNRKSVDSILVGFIRIVDQLQELADKEKNRSMILADTIDDLVNKKDMAILEFERALTAKKKIEGLLV